MVRKILTIKPGGTGTDNHNSLRAGHQYLIRLQDFPMVEKQEIML